MHVRGRVHACGMSDDFGSYSYGSAGAAVPAAQQQYQPAYGGAAAARGGSAAADVDVDDDPANDPPLLDELGIDLSEIALRTKAVLFPTTQNAHVMHNIDLAGPFVFCVLLASELLLRGQVRFTYIYGIGGAGVLGLFALLNLMSTTGISLHVTTCVLGYCMLPVCILALFGLVMSPTGLAALFVAALCVFWCAFAASLIFVQIVDMHDQRLLVAYPVALVYAMLALIALF